MNNFFSWKKKVNFIQHLLKTTVMAKKYTKEDLNKDLEAIHSKMLNSTDETIKNESDNLNGFKNRVNNRLNRKSNP